MTPGRVAVELLGDSVGDPRMLGVGGPLRCAYLRRLELIPPSA